LSLDPNALIKAVSDLPRCPLCAKSGHRAILFDHLVGAATNADAKVTPRSVATDNIETKGLDGGQFALRRIEIGPTALASPISWEDQLGICSIPWLPTSSCLRLRPICRMACAIGACLPPRLIS